MPLRNPFAVPAALSSHYTCIFSPGQVLRSTASSAATSRCMSSRTYNHHPHHQRRTYAATPSGDHKPRHNDRNANDIPAWPSHKNPTPYDIFAINRTDAYTKRRFYQLVKLYHPDLASSSSSSKPSSSTSSSASSSSAAASGVPHAVRLQRYHLIVAANTLLSDPAKRHAYDTYGLGWTSPSSLSAPDMRRADRAWRSQPGSATSNATWEDWERWYEARSEGSSTTGANASAGAAVGASGRQGVNYMPNGIFAMLIAMTCIIGAMVQGSRAESAGARYVETKAQKNQEVGEHVRRSTQASAGMSKDERVGRFLRDRENIMFQFSPGRYESSGDDEQRDSTSNSKEIR